MLEPRIRERLFPLRRNRRASVILGKEEKVFLFGNKRSPIFLMKNGRVPLSVNEQ